MLEEKHKLPYFIRKVKKNGNIGAKQFKGLEGHYLLIIPLKITTRKENNSFRSSCRLSTEYCKFSFLGEECKIYTDGLTEHLKPMIPLIKDKILNDCIKNPRKYLEELEN